MKRVEGQSGTAYLRDLFTLLEQATCFQDTISPLTLSIVERELHIEFRELRDENERKHPINNNQSSTWYSILIKENFGLKKWLLQKARNPLIEQFLSKHHPDSLIIVPSCQYQTALVIRQNMSENIFQKDESMNSYDIGMLMNLQKIDLEEITMFIRLQRLFKRNYLIFFKYLSRDVIERTKMKEQQTLQNQWDRFLSLDLFLNDNDYDDELGLDQNFCENNRSIRLLNESGFDFDKMAYIEEQKSINRCSSHQEIVKGISVLYEVIDTLEIFSFAQKQYGDTIDIFSGLVKSKKNETNFEMFIFENESLLLIDERVDIMKILFEWVSDIILSKLGIDKYSYKTQIISKSLGFEREYKKIRKQVGFNYDFSFVFMINFKLQNSTCFSNEELLNGLVQSLSEQPQLDQYFQNIVDQFFKNGIKQKIAITQEEQIPQIVSIISDFSDLINQPLDSSLKYTLQQSLNKKFLLYSLL